MKEFFSNIDSYDLTSAPLSHFDSLVTDTASKIDDGFTRNLTQEIASQKIELRLISGFGKQVWTSRIEALQDSVLQRVQHSYSSAFRFHCGAD
ncbi:MAG TPA: hypothetical protein VGU67_02480 [Edaphobacter sp.]|nr:hypothetical protein [Edaphobacter sp.]